jgi:hypothetical protein
VTELFKFQHMKLKFRPNHGPSPMVVPPRYSIRLRLPYRSQLGKSSSLAIRSVGSSFLTYLLSASILSFYELQFLRLVCSFL